MVAGANPPSWQHVVMRWMPLAFVISPVELRAASSDFASGSFSSLFQRDAMSRSDIGAVSRVISADGTVIGWSTTGDGPPLVLVHGTAADRTRWRPLLPYLEPYFTVHAPDRRGRGVSGDAPLYAIEREYEDIAAVVDTIAREAKSEVHLYGHSHGAFVAFGAAALTSRIRRLALYEGWPLPDPRVLALPLETEEQIDALVARGDREEAVVAVFRAFTLMSDEELRAFRAAPSWAGRVAAAHTITREVRAEASTILDPRVAARIRSPTLLLTGERSQDPSRRYVDAILSLLPDARHVMLEGQEHVADVLAPESFAGRLVHFLQSEAE